MSKHGNTLIADNNSDTIDNITDVLEYVFTRQESDSGSMRGEQIVLKMVHGAALSLKSPEK